MVWKLALIFILKLFPVRYGLARSGWLRLGSVCYGVVRLGRVVCVELGYDRVRYGKAYRNHNFLTRFYGVVRCDVVLWGQVRSGRIRTGVVWKGLVWQTVIINSFGILWLWYG